MASLRILLPDATINYVKNPSFRYDTTGWTATGATLTRSLDYARFNIASLKVVAAGSVLGEGCYYRVSALLGVSEPVTASVYLRGSGIVRVRLTTDNTYVSENIELVPTRWQRVVVSGFSAGRDDVRLYVETAFRVQAATFYIDGAQIERHPYETTYCDGDQPGCYWNILAHGSVSKRDGDTRLGGRWVQLAGCDREKSDLYFTVVGGLGMAPIRNNLQSYADAPGSFLQNAKVLERVVTITFHTRSTKTRPAARVSLQDLHKLRQMLLDILKPDRTAGDEEFLIEYQDGVLPLYFRARYDGGLEGEWDVRNQWTSSFPVRLIVVSPFLVEDSQDVQQLSYGYNYTVNRVIQRFNGVWSEMNGGMDNTVLAMEIGTRGEVIAAGQFVHANNKVTAIDPMIFANRICYWDGTQWRGYGGGANNVVRAIAVAPNGDIYATGDFTSIGGVACNRVARWNAAGSTWVAMGTGLNGTGRAIRVAPNGDVYVGGDFTTAGGSNCRYVARWDGGSWQPLGANTGLNAAVYCLAISKDGSQVFAGGDFTDEYSAPGILALNYIGLYYPSTNDWWEVADGFSGRVLSLTISPSGRLYASGEFLEAGNSTGQILLYIAYFNGAQWSDLNGGADNIVRAVDVDASGNVLAVGDFGRIGSVDASYAALWNGSVWAQLDIGTGVAGYAGRFDAKGNIFLGTGTTIDLATVNTVTNTGSAEASPKLYILGPVTLKWIENETAHKRLYADLPILSGEEVVIDFAKGTAISSARGDLGFAILPGSDFRAWKLQPGDNKIVALMQNGLASKMQISYVPRHWSVDATQNTDAF